MGPCTNSDVTMCNRFPVEHWRKGTPFIISLPGGTALFNRELKTSVFPNDVILGVFLHFVLLFNFGSVLSGNSIMS
jgi:hypothetical protein